MLAVISEALNLCFIWEISVIPTFFIELPNSRQSGGVVNKRAGFGEEIPKRCRA